MNLHPASLLAVPLALVAALTMATFGAAAQTHPAAPGISDGIVKIGVILDMTGPLANVTGTGSVTAARMAIADFGGKVIGAPIELVVADHHDSTDRAAAIARDWFGPQHVDSVMDVSGSSEALIVQAIGRTRNKIVSLSAPGAVRLTNEACSPTAVHYTFDTYAIAHTIAPALVRMGGDTWFFITVDNAFGYDLESNTGAVVKAAGGIVLGHARHPLDAPDFVSYLAQAQESGAKVIALANAGEDAINTIRTAAKRHMIPGKQLVAGLSMRIGTIDTLGLVTAQGMMLAEPFYWDLNDATRTWSRRFFARTGKMPNALQAGLYSSVTHYLQAIAHAGTDATGPVMQAMRAAPIDDLFAHNGHIRADGLMVHDMYLFQVKTPAQSHYPWDYLRRVATVPGGQAFEPLSQSKCPLVKH